MPFQFKRNQDSWTIDEVPLFGGKMEGMIEFVKGGVYLLIYIKAKQLFVKNLS
jgi:hypothetical protein